MRCAETILERSLDRGERDTAAIPTQVASHPAVAVEGVGAHQETDIAHCRASRHRHEVVRMDEQIVFGCQPVDLFRRRLQVDGLTLPVRDQEVDGRAARGLEYGLDSRPERTLR